MGRPIEFSPRASAEPVLENSAPPSLRDKLFSPSNSLTSAAAIRDLLFGNRLLLPLCNNLTDAFLPDGPLSPIESEDETPSETISERSGHFYLVAK